jgi:peptidyl-prolyl cis-trans isomerase D
MFSFFRRGFTAKIMLIVLGIALFALVVTGFGTGGDMGALGQGRSTLVSVEGEDVTEQEVTNTVNQQISQFRQQQPDFNLTEFFSAGAFEQILDQMVSSLSLTVFGRELGFTASKQMIDREIVSIPAFQGLTGRFDEATFRRALQTASLTEDMLRKEIAGSMIQRQLLLPVGAMARAPESMALQYASLLLEQRRGMIGAVPAEAVGPGKDPTDQNITAYYRENQNRYIIPERRVLRYAVFGRDQIGDAVRPTEQEIVAFYQQSQERYAGEETRTLSQIVLPDEAAARAFAQRVQGGQSFEQAAQAAGFSREDIAVGRQTRQQFANLSSAGVAEAAWRTQQGGVTSPVRSPLGWHVVRVEAVTSAASRPLAAVRVEIAQEIEKRKTEEALSDLVARIEDSLTVGNSFEEVARANGLRIQQTPPITAAGRAPNDANWQPPQELQPMLRTAFDMELDEDPVVETVQPGERFAILDVANVTPPAAPPLAEIRDRVRADLIARWSQDRARRIAAEIVGRVNKGVSMADAFRAAGVTLPAPQSVNARRMDISQGGEQVPPPLRMLFSLPEGRANIQEAPNGAGWFVVHLQEATPGDASQQPQLIQTTRAQFSQGMGEEYAEQFARAVQSRQKIRRNEQAIQRAKQQLERQGQ